MKMDRALSVTVPYELSKKMHDGNRIFDDIFDGADNRILECAEKFGADMIISGDNHLLKLGKYLNIKIITPADYIRSKPNR
jgi:predicted nucleic acid-binding protein